MVSKDQPISVMIVDDNPGAANLLALHLKSIPNIHIIANVSSAGEAYRLLMESVPDILFLDVEMPGKSGFDLLHDLQKLDIHPCVVFHTGFREYAIEAIKHAAFDYLLKPVDGDEVLAAVTRFRTQQIRSRLDDRIDKLYRHLNEHRKIRFNTRQGFIMLDPTEIVYCMADWSYTELFLNDGRTILVSMNIGKILTELDQNFFIRINRSVIINIRYLNSVDRVAKKCMVSYGGTEKEFRVTKMMKI